MVDQGELQRSTAVKNSFFFPPRHTLASLGGSDVGIVMGGATSGRPPICMKFGGLGVFPTTDIWPENWLS